MADLSFNIKTEKLEDTRAVIKSLDSVRFCYEPLRRNDTEYHILVEGGIDDISKLAQYLSNQK